MTDKMADDKEPPGPVPEGAAIKNKWKVHKEMAPVLGKVCPETTDSLILFEWIQEIKQFSEKRWGGQEGEWMPEFFPLWIPLMRALTQTKQLRFLDLNDHLHAETWNPFRGYLCLRNLFNMESQLYSSTVKPKDIIIFHLLQVVPPYHSSHLENHVVIHKRNLRRRRPGGVRCYCTSKTFIVFFNC